MSALKKKFEESGPSKVKKCTDCNYTCYICSNVLTCRSVFLPLCLVWFCTSRPLTPPPSFSTTIASYFSFLHYPLCQQDWIFHNSSYVQYKCVSGHRSEAEGRNTKPASWAFCCLSAKPIICGKKKTPLRRVSFSLSPWQLLPRWTASWDSQPLLAVFHRAAIHIPVTGYMWLEIHAILREIVETKSGWVQWVLMGSVWL